jgi:hypothetical protein
MRGERHRLWPFSPSVWLLHFVRIHFQKDWDEAQWCAIARHSEPWFRVPALQKRGVSWWCTPVIPVLRRQGENDQEFKASLG